MSSTISSLGIIGIGTAYLIEELPANQQWTVLGVLAVTLVAAFHLVKWIGGRMVKSVDTNTKSVDENTKVLSGLVSELKSNTSDNRQIVDSIKHNHEILKGVRDDLHKLPTEIARVASLVAMELKSSQKRE